MLWRNIEVTRVFWASTIFFVVGIGIGFGIGWKLHDRSVNTQESYDKTNSVDLKKPVDKRSEEWAKHIVVKRLKEAMHDPYSFELVSIRLLEGHESFYNNKNKLKQTDLTQIHILMAKTSDTIPDLRTFRINYRGKNAYGALRLSTTNAAHIRNTAFDMDFVHFFKYRDDE